MDILFVHHLSIYRSVKFLIALNSETLKIRLLSRKAINCRVALNSARLFNKIGCHRRNIRKSVAFASFKQEKYAEKTGLMILLRTRVSGKGKIIFPSHELLFFYDTDLAKRGALP